MEHMQPKPECPLKMPSIKLLNATADLRFASRFPLDGFTWITSLKLYKSIAHVRHKKQLLFCIMCETPITKSRRQPEGTAYFHAKFASEFSL